MTAKWLSKQKLLDREFDGEYTSSTHSSKHPTEYLPSANRKCAPGRTCLFCEKYYTSLNVPNLQERLNLSSRHRGEQARPPTPEHFFELEFPEPDECVRRGYCEEKPQPYIPSSSNRYLNK